MPRGEIVRYEESWFLAIIQEAAQRAGIKDVWFAEHIARGIVIYLRERFSQSSIGIEELFAKIAQTLQVVGFPQIARQLEPSAPPATMCLDTLAAQAGNGYELSFFQLLASALRDARDRGSVHVHCAGLEPAVNRLCQSKRWSRRSERLRDEILTFVSSEVCAAPSMSRFSAIVS
jgi:hypothetical protein